MTYSLYVLAALFLSACTPPPGNWGLIEGVERVFPLEEVRVIEHPGTLREATGSDSDIIVYGAVAVYVGRKVEKVVKIWKGPDA